MEKLSDKTVLVIGYGIFECFMALRLAESFGRVLLFVPWEGSYPMPNDIGVGLPGVTKVEDFDSHVEEADLICFFDVGFVGKQAALRKQGKRVFGTGTAADMEYDRVGFKKTLDRVGLPVGPYQTVKGIDALHSLLKKEKNKFVKVSKYRGVCETFHHKDYKFSVPKLDQVAAKLGARRMFQEFLIEDVIPGVEVGDDRFYVNGVHLPIWTEGIENKDKGYVCKIVTEETTMQPCKEVADALAPIYKKHDVCGMMSSEIRVGKDLKPYFIDCCSRGGSPPSELLSELYENFAEIVWGVAGGEMVVPIPRAKYAAEVLIKSEMAPTDWVPMDFKEKDLKVLKLRNLCQIEGQYYYVPQDGGTILGGAIGFGDTLEEAQSEALSNTALLNCEASHFCETAFDETDEEIMKAEEYGLGTF